MGHQAKGHLKLRALVAEAVRLAGSQVALAGQIGRSQQLISALCTRARAISAEDAIAIHRATRGKVPASALRPDLWRRPEHVPAHNKAQTEGGDHEISDPGMDVRAVARRRRQSRGAMAAAPAKISDQGRTRRV